MPLSASWTWLKSRVPPRRLMTAVPEATCLVEHRHASDVRRTTPGALAPVQVMLFWTIIT